MLCCIARSCWIMDKYLLMITICIDLVASNAKCSQYPLLRHRVYIQRQPFYANAFYTICLGNTATTRRFKESQDRVGNTIPIVGFPHNWSLSHKHNVASGKAC